MLSRFAAVPLLSLLPLVWRAGLGLARRATRDERLARFLAPGAALALWAVAVHAIGLARHSFYLGLFLGTLLCAGLGLWSYLRKETPIPQTPSPPAGERAGVRGPPATDRSSTAAKPSTSRPSSPATSSPTPTA